MPTVGDLETMPGVAKELNVLATQKVREELENMSEEESWNGQYV